MCDEKDGVERPQSCRGCEHFQQYRGKYTVTGWQKVQDDNEGCCMFEPVPVPRNADDKACRYGIPKRAF